MHLKSIRQIAPDYYYRNQKMTESEMINAAAATHRESSQTRRRQLTVIQHRLLSNTKRSRTEPAFVVLPRHCGWVPPSWNQPRSRLIRVSVHG